MTLNEAKHLYHGQIIYHRTLRNSDGTAMRFKVNGSVKTWKCSPSRVRVPLKHGLWDYLYIEPHNINEFVIEEPTS